MQDSHRDKKRLYAGSYFVNDVKRLTREIHQVPGVVTVAPRIEVGAYIDHKGLQAPASGLGLDKGVALQSWRNSSYFAKMLPLMDVYVYFLGGLIVFIAGIGLMNTMTMSVMERKGEGRAPSEAAAPSQVWSWAS